MRVVETFTRQPRVRIDGVEDEGVGNEVDGEPEEQVEEGGEARFPQNEKRDEREEGEIKDHPVAGQGTKNNSRWKSMNSSSEIILREKLYYLSNISSAFHHTLEALYLHAIGS